MSDIKTIGVLGAGQMGGGIAQVAAVAGFNAVVFDSFPGAIEKCRGLHGKMIPKTIERAKKYFEQNYSLVNPKGDPAAIESARKTMSETPEAISGRIRFVDKLENLTGCDWVVEAVVEDVKVKKDLFATLAKMYPSESVVLASNTSSISITEIATACGATAHRVVGMHFFNPVPLMQLVEVIPGIQTSKDVTERTIALATKMGKTPLKANDRAGFISNRVLMPMINEAFYAWMEGVAEPEAIDGIMKLGCNFPMGPLRLADYIGLDTCEKIMGVLADGLNNDRYRACPLLKQLVVAGRLGDKTGRGVFEYAGK